MVKFIVGKADLNISSAVRANMISLLENNALMQKIIYIVPDQFEYETEKAVYRILEQKNLLNRFYEINITTFTRLCGEILEQNGEHRPFADDIIKNIIMHKSVSENKVGLSALNKIAARQGFCGKMVKTISALKTSGITAKDLEMCLDALCKTDKSISADSPLIKKLCETNTLYSNYEGLLKGYVDSLDVTGMAANYIGKSSCKTFHNANVFVDCFNDFTNSQLNFLKCVIKRADNVMFGFTSNRLSDKDVFKTANGHINSLRKEALDNAVDVEFITSGIESRFAENEPLCGISRHIFQSAKSRESLGESCELVSARSVYEELDYAAAKIKELTIDRKMRYNEIAVLCTDVGSYGKYVENTFKKYDIPIFLDTPEPILYQPLINLVISILNTVSDYSVDNVLSCVKTKFFAKPKSLLDDDDEEFPDDSGAYSDNDQLTLFEMFGESAAAPSNDREKYITLSDKDVDQFESYIFEWDLKTRHLNKPFSFISPEKDNNNEQQTAETVRRSVAEPLLDLRKKIGKASDGAEITELLYNFLINKVGMKRAIFKRCKNEQNTALDMDKVELYQRLWNSLIDIFNKLHSELADTNISIAEYRDLFREICLATKLASPPQYIDCVLVGDIDRTRADNIKAAFIIGATYDAFPTQAFESGIFSQYDIEMICDKIVHIDNAEDISLYIDTINKIGESTRAEYCLKSVKEQYYLSLYRAYRAVTLPTEYLCISCPEKDISGEQTTRSDIFAEICSTFKTTEIIAANSKGNKFYCRTPKSAKIRYAMGLNEGGAENQVLRRVLEHEDGEFVLALDEIRDARKDLAYENDKTHFSGKHTLSAKSASLLFPESMGATSVEKLNICKFNYFCEYGLKITEKNKRSFTNSKRGEAMHFIFQNILEEYCGDMEKFFALRRGELLALAKKYLAIYRESETNNDNTDDKRTEYLFNNIANSAADVLITMQTELFARKYRPKFFELAINSNRNGEHHNIIENEDYVLTVPPDAEIFSLEEISPDVPKSAACPENAPYIITAPLNIELNNGSEVTVQGIIDRVDMFSAGKNENGKPIAYIRVVDYKSSTHTFDLNNAQNGINIQMLMYLFALQNANKDNPALELRPGGVNYVPSRNNGASEEKLSPYRLLAMNYHESGLFIKDNFTEDDLNRYKKAVFEKLESDNSIDRKDLEKIKSTFEPKESNLAESEFFEDLRRDVMEKITENLNAIFSGTIDALPTQYYETSITANGGKKSKLKDPCEYCRFGDICKNAGKNVNKLANAQGKSKVWENKYIKGDEKNGGK